MAERKKLSLIVITKNEEANLRECLESAEGLPDEIVIVDDESTDRTREIAREFTDKIYSRKMDLEGRHRNWAASRATHDWVLWMDADERMTPELKEEIRQTLSQSNANIAAYWIPRKNYLGKRWLKHGGWYAAHIKLYDRRLTRWREVVHDVVHPGIDIAEGYSGKELKKPLIHYNFKNIEDFIQKVNRHSTFEAVKWHLQGKRITLWHGLWKAFDRFWKRYVYKMGFLDGLEGFVAAFLSGFYQFAAYCKFREIRKEGIYLDRVAPSPDTKEQPIQPSVPL